MNKILAAWAWNGPVSEPIAYGEGHITRRMLSPNKQRKNAIFCKKSILIHSKTRTV